MPLSPSTCPLDCPDACGVLVETDEAGRFLGVRGDPAHAWSRGHLCGKTARYGELVTGAERLLRPLVRGTSGALSEASWDEAVGRIAERLSTLDGAEILAAWYGGTMGLVGRKFPLRVMHALGATFVGGSLCSGAGAAGHRAVLGPTVGADIESVEDADLLLLWGCDASRTVQHLLPRLQRLCRRGVPVVAIDVYRTDTIRALERWGGRGLVLRPATDAALALGLARLAYERGHADRAFLARECLGAEVFEAHARAAHDLADVAAVTGLAPEEISALSELLGEARNPFIKTGVGWTRRRRGAMGMRAVCCLSAVLGCAQRLHFESADCFGLAEEVIELPALRPVGAPAPRVRHVALGRELDGGRFKAAFVWGHNPVATVPDSARVRRGLARPDLFLVVHDHVLTETARLADVVLPATTFVEHADVYRSYGHRWLSYARAACAPPGGPEGPRSNVHAFATIARALELDPRTWDVDEEGLCEALLEASRERLGEAGLSALRAGRRFKLSPPTFATGRWGTPSGKIELLSTTAPACGQPELPVHQGGDDRGERGAFHLVAAPSVHTHNSTFCHSPLHQRRAGPAAVHVSPQDAAALNLAEAQVVRLESATGAVSLPVAISEDMPPGVVRVDGPLNGEQTPEGLGVNALVSPDVSDMGECNAMFSTRVDLRH